MDIELHCEETGGGEPLVLLHGNGEDGTAYGQRADWAALCEIPYGETRSYGQIAARLGNPKACRAVGMANHRNPVAVLVPCHRVVGKNGSLTGYAGGLDVKEGLLALEKRCGG